MRRVSIGMIEAVLLIKYRNTQPDSTAVLRKEYRSTLRTVLQYFLRSTGRCLSHLSKSLLPRPGRVPWRSSHPSWGSAWRRGVSCMASLSPAIISRPLLYLIIFGRGRAFRRTYRTGRAMAFPAADSLPDKFVDCLLTYEDKRFFYHPV